VEQKPRQAVESGRQATAKPQSIQIKANQVGVAAAPATPAETCRDIDWQSLLTLLNSLIGQHQFILVHGSWQPMELEREDFGIPRRH
jgi:hypothetical protein